MITSRRERAPVLAAAFCALFGLAMIANVNQVGDGVWHWYGTLLAGGQRLYADLHFSQQPLYVLETRALLAVFGSSWLASKIPALLHLLAVCTGLYQVARRSRWPAAHQAILTVAGFFLLIHLEASRFDDYHALAQSFMLWSLVLILRLREQSSPGAVAGLGALSGLLLTTRANDGLAEIAAISAALLLAVPGERWRNLGLFLATAAATVLAVVWVSGDTFADYASNSLLKAASAKGGPLKVLAAPANLFGEAFGFLLSHPWAGPRVIAVAILGAAWAFLVRPYWKPQPRRIPAAGALAGTVLMAAAIYFIFIYAKTGNVIDNLTALGVVAAYAGGVVLMIRLGLRWWRGDFSPHAGVLALIPLGALVAGSMSTGGQHGSLYTPFGYYLILLPFLAPSLGRIEWPRQMLLAAALCIIAFGFMYRLARPFAWHNYVSQAMFLNRTVLATPAHGPMVIEHDVVNLIRPVCEIIQASGRPELLSMPYPYANYFCSIRPWHGYVQTFYDTSTPALIGRLQRDLEKAPPAWILYQRQPSNLALHERIFNEGRPLAHRVLEQFIDQRVASGAWRVRRRVTRAADEWDLVDTRAAGSSE